jgi:Fur family peroxide stress response transcriptional regulator
VIHTRAGIVAALRSAGRRITLQRMAILEHLAGRSDHPSARQIHNELEDLKVHVSLATVYNTLASLVELGLLKEVEFESVDNRYDTNLASHINLVCTSCGAIVDVDHEPPLSAREIQDRTGFDTSEIKIEYCGTCKSCRKLVATSKRKPRGGRS